MEKKRSIGIIISSCFIVFYALFFLAQLLIAVSKMIQTHEYENAAVLGIYGAILLLLVTYFLLGIGLFKLNNLARKGVVIFLSIINIPEGLFQVYAGRARNKISGTAILIIASMLIFYLTRPKVKEQFK